MKKILLIQTGGTIAMDISQGEAKLDPDRWARVIYREIPELSEIAEIGMEQLFLEDSSDISRSHWEILITCISENFEKYDGFVILHGTDTMAYTASALSFGLQQLSKPVIFTGSQVPMSTIRSDARRNLVNAIEIATLPLQEVAICFNDFVYRGNRTTKMSIGHFDAFDSPNFPPLAEIGLDITLNVSSPSEPKDLITYSDFSNELFLLKIYPNLDPAFLAGMDLSSVRALVLETFGSGNYPMYREQSLLPFLKKCIEQEIVIAITSQAPYDAVDLDKYQSGQKAREIGALSAGDMTTEATLTKLMYLLERYDEQEKIKKLFKRNLAGELTE